MKKVSYAVVFLTTYLLAGCASITTGTSQTLIFNLDPRDVVCDVTRDGDGLLGTVSQSHPSIHVSKDKDDIVISCRAQGYKPKTVKIVSSVQTAGAVGVMLDFGITDMITGAMYKYPDSTNISLEKE
jgi:uncharacterized protein YcfL